ncbi:hypothetical protein HDV04_000599 [Boothiomyces sp. JEL0838]|nr:hypothetical protein HDV04_000599 [Boothiomyces sp. JEL0838]
MPSLSLDQIKELAKNGNTIPVYEIYNSDLITPISCYLKLQSKYSFLFESIYGGEKIGPRKILDKFEGDPVIAIENELKGIKPVPVDGLPSFTGGAVGFISYDCVQYFEPKTKRDLKDPLGIPDAVMMMCDTIVIFDHLHSLIKICSNVFVKEGATEKDIEKAYKNALNEISIVQTKLDNNPAEPPTQGKCTIYESVSNVGEEGYKGFVAKIKESILKGDVIQTVPSQRLKKKTDLHPFNAYRKLRTVNPSPYMFYLDLGDFTIVGASPEMLVKVEDRKVFMHPIAGTRKRGKTVEEDNELARDLLSDLKERSEHVMLVDLGRNDVNRICDPKTVKVDSLMHIEKYAHVMHIVSNVSGILRPDKTPFDAFRSIFPAGTVSGAPKVKAMEIIYELEGEKRGVYAGSVGHFGYSGGLDTCISIRTMVFKDGHVYLQAGGGIVHDSDPDAEFIETINKLKSNVVALQEAEMQYQ